MNASSTLTLQDDAPCKPHIPPSLMVLSDHIHGLADELQECMQNDKQRSTLYTIREMRRSLTTLEFELLDGEHCGRGDAT